MSQVTSVDGQDPYVIRRGEPSDADAFCSLFETVWDHERDREWFRWKYVENPSVDHVPMFVAEADGELVGTRPYVALRMRAGEATPLALLTADTMVHPDHRRRGLFTRMTERSLAFYADREPEFSFNQPNERSLSGYRKLGWQPLDAMTTYFRVQNPGSLAAAKTNDGTLGALARAATPLTDAALAVLDRYGSRDPDLAVHSEPDVAVEPLVEAYRNDVPDAVHALRDERFYRWRFASPAWQRRTYVATDDGPIAAILVRTRTNDEGIVVTQLADVVPLSGGERWRAAVARLVVEIVADYADSDVISAPGRAVPGDVLTPFGFLPDDRFPFSRLKAADCTLAVRPFHEDWRLGGIDLTDAENWRLSFAERDTT